MSTKESNSWRCPECKKKQTFMADEWPDPCVCGYDPNAPKEKTELEKMVETA